MKNDQGHIIDAIKKKDYAYVWDIVKYIGINECSDLNERYIIFHKALLDFDTDKNNNFIWFYKKYLNYLNFNKNQTFRVSSSVQTIKKLKAQAISPTNTKKQRLLDKLKQWNN